MNLFSRETLTCLSGILLIRLNIYSLQSSSYRSIWLFWSTDWLFEPLFKTFWQLVIIDKIGKIQIPYYHDIKYPPWYLTVDLTYVCLFKWFPWSLAVIWMGPCDCSKLSMGIFSPRESSLTCPAGWDAPPLGSHRPCAHLASRAQTYPRLESETSLICKYHDSISSSP